MVNKDIPKKFMQEFKAFAMKGNVVDLAVAVVIGGLRQDRQFPCCGHHHASGRFVDRRS